MEKVKKGWAKLPYQVLTDERLGKSDVLIYAVLRDMTKGEKRSISIKRMAEMTGLSEKTVGRATERLRKAGYVKTRATGRELIYDVLDVTETMQEQEKSKQDERAEQEQRLMKKLKHPERVSEVLDELTREAERRVKNKKYVAAYVNKMIDSYKDSDNSDGFDADKYSICINNF